MMIRVHVICEGRTEEKFVKELLVPHFSARSVHLDAVGIGRPGHKGGNVNLQRLSVDIGILLHDSKSFCTTLFDFYGMDPHFPGYQECASIKDTAVKAGIICDRLVQHLHGVVNEDNLRRFIPYVQMHEFEGLLFSNPKELNSLLDLSRFHVPDFQKIRDDFKTPEDINDSPQTAPSKRIKTFVPTYGKTTHGPALAERIGLPTIRRECPLFDAWVTRLESLEPLEN